MTNQSLRQILEQFGGACILDQYIYSFDIAKAEADITAYFVGLLPKLKIANYNLRSQLYADGYNAAIKASRKALQGEK